MTGRSAGLKDADTLQSRESAFQLIPDPFGDVLRGRVAQAIDLVQIIMIQVAVHQRLEGGLDTLIIDKPAELRVHLSPDGYRNLETVTVEAVALVGGRNVGESVRYLTK